MLATIISYRPQTSGSLWIDQRGATFQTQVRAPEAKVLPHILNGPQKGWVNYAAYQDHSSCLFAGEKESEIFGRARGYEATALRWNFFLRLRLLPLGGIALYATLSQIKIVKWGQGVTPSLWGTAAGLAMQELASPLIVGAALAHTFLIKGSLVSLLKKGSLPFLAHCSWVLAVSAQSRINFYRGWQEREQLQGHYRNTWRKIDQELENALQAATRSGIEEINLLYTQTQLLAQAQISQLYGASANDFKTFVSNKVARLSHLQNFAHSVRYEGGEQFSLSLLKQAHNSFSDSFLKNNNSQNFEKAFVIAHYYASFNPSIVNWEQAGEQLKQLKENFQEDAFIKWVEGRTGAIDTLSIEHQKILDCYGYVKEHLITN